MYLMLYSLNIIRLLARMLLGLRLSEMSTVKLLKSIELKFNGQFAIPTFKKIKKFQAIQQFVINDSFAMLENRYTNKMKEKATSFILY